MIPSFAELFDSKDNIISLFYERIKESEPNKKVEYDAAVKIQRCWRGVTTRRVLKRMNNAALVIQKCVRKHFAGKAMLIAKFEKDATERSDYYNFQAKQIQRVWRGFYSRKYTFNYYKWKAFIDEQATKNTEMDTKLHEYCEAAECSRCIINKENGTFHPRYPIGTSAIPSMFDTPSYRKEVENYIASENHIRAVNKARIVIPSLNSGRLQQ